jgi:Mg-chelatase subunit ChlD
MKRTWALLLLIGCGSAEDHPDRMMGDASRPQASAYCEDEDHDGYGIGCALGGDCDDHQRAITDQCYRCAEPGDGCPCSSEGSKVACGKIESRTEDGRVICFQGERLCRDGTWSACTPSEILDDRAKLKALGAPVGCTNPCDPYCKSFPDSPDDTLSNDAGVVGTDAGLTVTPTALDAGPPASCASTTAEAKPVPLDIAVMLDASGSMAGTRWNSVTSALNSYASSAAAKGVSMALGAFPHLETTAAKCCFWFFCWDCSTTTDSCDAAAYGKFLVPMGALPGNAMAIQTALSGLSPNGGTPTKPALEGALNFAKANQAAAPGHKSIVVLATDGEPNDCSGTVAGTSAVASAGYAAGIGTYVIGVGPSLTNLDAIAKAGSGGKESYIPVPSGDTTAFIDAMKRIQTKAASCDYVLPSPASGDVVADATDVQLKNTSTGATTAIARKSDKGACTSSDGFFFDGGKLTLCPSTCATINASATHKLEVVFKCAATCGKGAFKADPVPVAMHVMLDKSGSMAGARWTNVTNALKTFINDPTSDGLAVGIDYFGQTSPSSDLCSQGNYELASVGIGMLPGNRTALVSSIGATSPGGNTPTEPALRGAITYARNYAIANPAFTPVVVLATDGEPTGCNLATNQPTPIGDNVARSVGLLGTPSVKTFVIGVGSGVSATGMNYIANRGGTSSAYMVNDGSPTAFLTAMRDIRKKTLSCEFSIPASSLGAINPSTLQARYPRDDGAVVKLPRIAAAASCSPGGGFYLDSPTSPKKLYLCPASCTDMNAQAASELYVFYDCLAGGDGTFVRDYRIDCPTGARPVWGLWSWNAVTPGDAQIDFTITSGDSLSELSTNKEVPMRFSSVPGPASLVGTAIGVRSTPVNAQVGAAYVDTSLALGALKRNTTFLRVRAKMKGTASSPVLKKWNQEVSCIPTE